MRVKAAVQREKGKERKTKKKKKGRPRVGMAAGVMAVDCQIWRQYGWTRARSKSGQDKSQLMVEWWWWELVSCFGQGDDGRFLKCAMLARLPACLAQWHGREIVGDREQASAGQGRARQGVAGPAKARVERVGKSKSKNAPSPGH